MKRAVLLLLGCAVGLTAGCGDDGEGKGGSGGGGGSGGSGVSITQLSAPVQIAVDEFGIPHITCATDEDCYAAVGYVHAQNRFFQMDLYRSIARGRLAGLLGLPGVDEGYFELRAFLTTMDGTPIEEAILADSDDATKTALEAYARGVNAWLADLRAQRNGARLSEEYDRLGYSAAEIPDWDVLDSLAFGRLLTYQLGETSGVELNGARTLESSLSGPVHAALFTQKPAVPSYTMPASGAPFPVRAPFDHELFARLREFLRPSLPGLKEASRRWELQHSLLSGLGDLAGSNNWVLAPARTAAGKALLANDPHLSLDDPPIWFFLEIDAKTKGTGSLHVAGASFPGAPVVPIGRSEDLSWGATVAYYDTSDVYQERLSQDGKSVRFDGADVPLIEKELTFPVRNQADQKRTYRWVPHHGPLLPGTDLSVRWTGHEPTHEIRAFLELNKATSIRTAFAALDHFRVGAQNFVMIDRSGGIAWYPHADVPSRPWASATEPGKIPWYPLDGTGGAEWDGLIPYDSLPRMTTETAVNGFIATANGDMTGATEDGDPTNDGYPMLQNYTANSYRHGRIVQLIQGDGDTPRTDHTVDTMIAIQGDTYSLPGATMLPALLDLADGAAGLNDAGTQVRAALAAWNYTCPTGLTGPTPDSPPSGDIDETRASAGCTAWHTLLRQLYLDALGDDYALAYGETGDDKREDAVNDIGNEVAIRTLTYLITDPSEFEEGVADELWDDRDTLEIETAQDIVVRSLNQTGADLTAHFKGGATSWRWGKVHTLTIDGLASALFPDLALGPYAVDGGLYSVDVANPRAAGEVKNFSFGSGPSLRIVSEATSEGIATWMALPGGQTIYRDSPHKGDLVEGYLNNAPLRFPFGGEPAFTPEATLTLQPAAP